MADDTLKGIYQKLKEAEKNYQQYIERFFEKSDEMAKEAGKKLSEEELKEMKELRRLAESAKQELEDFLQRI